MAFRFEVVTMLLGARTKEEWAVDFLEHKGYYPKDFPDDRELDEYMETNIAAKLRFFSEDYNKKMNEFKSNIKSFQHAIDSNERTAYKFISDLTKEYEAKTKELQDLKDSLEL